MIASLAQYWAPLLGYMGLLFWISSRPRPETVDVVPDFVLHGGAYFVLALLAIRALGKGLVEPVSAGVVASGVALTVLYGASDEWHQSFVPSRYASIDDFVFDVFGALLAVVALHAFWRLRSRLAAS